MIPIITPCSRCSATGRSATISRRAIEWAWELLTKVYGLPEDRFYATVFEGSEEDGVAFDSEAYAYWKRFLPEERILRGNKKDNFWEMGDTGPCGPCSEIHFDLRWTKSVPRNPDGSW